MLEYWVIKAESFFFYNNRNSAVLIGWLNCFNPIIPKFQYSSGTQDPLLMTTRYFNIANILLLTVGVFLCVQAFYTLVTPRPDYSISVTPAVRPVSTSAASYSPPPPGDYKAITERNIFNSGTEKIAPKAQTVDIEQLKQTDLKLKLWGTVTGQKGRAYAVIEDTKTREQNLYHAGDTIQNAVVKLILREKVVLNVDDRDEILAMEEISSRRGSAGTAQKRVRASSGTGGQKTAGFPLPA